VYGENFKTPHIEKRVIGRAATNPAVTIMFHVPPIWHDDLAPLYVLGRTMSARTGKMYLDLVNSKMPHATTVAAMASNSMYDGAFRVSATARETPAETTVVPLATLEQELWMYVETRRPRRSTAGPAAREERDRGEYLQSLAGMGNRRHAGRMETAYRWQFIEEQYRQRMAVTAADLHAGRQDIPDPGQQRDGVMERER